jgi:hypothetical protein
MGENMGSAEGSEPSTAGLRETRYELFLCNFGFLSDSLIVVSTRRSPCIGPLQRIG